MPRAKQLLQKKTLQKKRSIFYEDFLSSERTLRRCHAMTTPIDTPIVSFDDVNTSGGSLTTRGSHDCQSVMPTRHFVCLVTISFDRAITNADTTSSMDFFSTNPNRLRQPPEDSLGRDILFYLLCNYRLGALPPPCAWRITLRSE